VRFGAVCVLVLSLLMGPMIVGCGGDATKSSGANKGVGAGPSLPGPGSGEKIAPPPGAGTGGKKR
jgi:hypothetical protein